MANLNLIKTLVKEKRITLKEFARQCDMSEQGLHRILRDNTTSIDTLETIARALGVSPAVFFDQTPGSASATGDGAIAIAGSGNVTIPKEVLDMLAQKDARIAELTDKLLRL